MMEIHRRLVNSYEKYAHERGISLSRRIQGPGAIGVSQILEDRGTKDAP